MALFPWMNTWVAALALANIEEHGAIPAVVVAVRVADLQIGEDQDVWRLGGRPDAPLPATTEAVVQRRALNDLTGGGSNLRVSRCLLCAAKITAWAQGAPAGPAGARSRAGGLQGRRGLSGESRAVRREQQASIWDGRRTGRTSEALWIQPKLHRSGLVDSQPPRARGGSGDRPSCR